MLSDTLLLLMGSLIGFFSALLLDYIKDKRELKHKESQNREDSIKLQTKDALLLLEKASQVSAENPSSLAWLKIVVFMGDSKGESNYVGRTRPKNDLDRETQPVSKRWKIFDSRPKNYPGSRSELPAQIDFGILEFVDNNVLEIQGIKFLLKKSNIIGRGSDCDISLPFDRLVSRKHLLIINDGNVFILGNLSPRNGTWINGHIIKDNKRRELNHGDKILIGDTLLQFETIATKVVDKDIAETITRNADE